MRGVDETVWCKLRPPELCVVLFKQKSILNVYEFHYFWRLFSSGQWPFLLQKTLCSCCSSSPIHVNVDSRKNSVISRYSPVSEHPISLSSILPPPPMFSFRCSYIMLMWWAFEANLFTSHNVPLLGLWLPITLFISKTNTNTDTLSQNQI